MGRHESIHCILPPYILEHMAHSSSAAMRELALHAIDLSSAARAKRATMALMPAMSAIPSPAAKKHRLVYDAKHGSWAGLPGNPVRAEGAPKVEDPAVNEAYGHAGATYDYFRKVHRRNSLDDHGMTLISSVHFGTSYDNALWDGEQMIYGDGDGTIFLRFTKAVDVVGHELTHGVVSHTCNLDYQGESGALNEHFADVFGSLVKQWRKRHTAAQADWLIGPAIMGPQPAATAAQKATALRTFKAGKAFVNNPYLGTDPQPKRLEDKYTGSDDNGGVHINSGIPNHAFYLVATTLGGSAWTKAAPIWYETLKSLGRKSGFSDMVAQTESAAIRLFGRGGKEHRAVVAAWKAVGF
jgi:Zn-dependent metalloprotease